MESAFKVNAAVVYCLSSLNHHNKLSPFQPSSPTLHPPKVMALDLCDANSIPAQAQTALRAFGRVDILVNNAGVSSRGSAVETELEVDRAVMEVNFFGPITLTKGSFTYL